MAEKGPEKIGTQSEAKELARKLADGDRGGPTLTLPQASRDGAISFRRQAALAVLTAYVQRHGGLGNDEVAAAHARMIWRFTDLFVAAEHAPEPAPPVSAPEPVHRRAAAPDDEWGVRHGDKLRRGFVTYEEADAYATTKPGSKVVQVSGPGAPLVPVAPLLPVA